MVVGGAGRAGGGAEEGGRERERERRRRVDRGRKGGAGTADREQREGECARAREQHGVHRPCGLRSGERAPAGGDGSCSLNGGGRQMCVRVAAAARVPALRRCQSYRLSEDAGRERQLCWASAVAPPPPLPPPPPPPPRALPVRAAAAARASARRATAEPAAAPPAAPPPPPAAASNSSSPLIVTQSRRLSSGNARRHLSRPVSMHSDAASQGGGWWAVARLTASRRVRRLSRRSPTPWRSKIRGREGPQSRASPEARLLQGATR